MDQMVDRESSVAFPNENAETMISMGSNLWHRDIDPEHLLYADRKRVDSFLLNNGIVRNYKEVNRFFAGCLNGVEIKINDACQKSQFMKFVFKGVLRYCIKNIMAFCKTGSYTKGI